MWGNPLLQGGMLQITVELSHW